MVTTAKGLPGKSFQDGIVVRTVVGSVVRTIVGSVVRTTVGSGICRIMQMWGALSTHSSWLVNQTHCSKEEGLSLFSE